MASLPVKPPAFSKGADEAPDRPSRSAFGSLAGWVSEALRGPNFGIVAATSLLILIGGLLQPESVSRGALAGMVPFAAILAIAALGQTVVVQQGGIDLSIAGMISLSGVIVSHYSQWGGEQGSGFALGAAATLTVSAAVGIGNGLLVTVAGIAPIVATLGTNALLYGAIIEISGGTPVAVPENLSAFSNASLWGVSSYAYLALCLALLVTLVVKRTVFGRNFEAVGASSKAARAAGLEANFYRIAAYGAAGCMYGVAGIMLAGLMTLPGPFQGDAYLLPSIAAVVMGGTSLLGGVGNLAASAIAAVFLTQLQQLVLTTGLSVGIQYLFQGGAIVVGVAVYSVSWRSLITSKSDTAAA